MNFVMDLSSIQIKTLLDFYRHNVKMEPSPHVYAVIKDEDLTITIYHSKKTMFQGKRAEEVFFFWHENFDLPMPPELTKPKLKDDYFTPSIGSDESGVGDYFGPLTVCAVYLSKDNIEFIKSSGVKDSKAMSDQQVIELAPKLMKQLTYSLLVLNNKKYNELLLKDYNANTLKAYLHAQSHKKLLAKIEDRPKIIVDQFCSEPTYHKYLKAFKDPIKPDLFITKAESAYASVAAASIIARYAFLVHLGKLSAKTGIKLLKGASKEVDLLASKLIKKGGMNALNHIAKIHFKTTEKAKALLDSNNPSY